MKKLSTIKSYLKTFLQPTKAKSLAQIIIPVWSTFTLGYSISQKTLKTAKSVKISSPPPKKNYLF